MLRNGAGGRVGEMSALFMDSRSAQGGWEFRAVGTPFILEVSASDHPKALAKSPPAFTCAGLYDDKARQTALFSGYLILVLVK